MPPIPLSGIVPLDAGVTYAFTKTIPVGCTFKRAGDPKLRNPIVRYTGPAESAAFVVMPGTSARFISIDFDSANHTYCFENQGALTADGVNFKGGTGLVKVVGSTGATIMDRCTQQAVSSHWVVYSGPKVTENANGYTEQFCGPIVLLDCDLSKGSAWFGLSRFHAYTTLYAKQCKLADPSENAGPGAKQDAGLRCMYGGDALLERCEISNDVHNGPLNAAGDGGDTLPLGPKRSFVDAERAKSITYNDCQFRKTKSFVVAPGANVNFVRCFDVPKLNMAGPYMSRPAGIATFDLATTRAK